MKLAELHRVNYWVEQCLLEHGKVGEQLHFWVIISLAQIAKVFDDFWVNITGKFQVNILSVDRSLEHSQDFLNADDDLVECFPSLSD